MGDAMKVILEEDGLTCPSRAPGFAVFDHATKDNVDINKQCKMRLLLTSFRAKACGSILAVASGPSFKSAKEQC